MGGLSLQWVVSVNSGRTQFAVGSLVNSGQSQLAVGSLSLQWVVSVNSGQSQFAEGSLSLQRGVFSLQWAVCFQD